MQNFRDIGGIETIDGRKVKRGFLFRSGVLSKAGPEDMKLLKNLQIRKLIDFRSEEEKDGRPIVENDGAELIPIPVENGAFTKEKITAMLASGDKAAFDNMLIEVNRSFVTDFSHEFSMFLKHLEEGKPTLFHCTAGKDRTGYATMLLLSALGVDRETIIADYMASNEYLAETIEQTIAFANATGKNGELLRPLMTVKREYIEAAWELIDEQYGSIGTYLSEKLKTDTEKLKNLYLED